MIKKLARSLFWRIANSDIMLIRRPAWRLLRFVERLTERGAVGSPEKKDHSASPHEPKHRKRLKEIYETIQQQRLSVGEEIIQAIVQRTSPGLHKRRSIVVVVPSIPKFDRNSSALRVQCILRAMSSRFSHIHLVHQAISEDDPLYRKSLPKNTDCHHIPFRDNNVEAYLKQERPEVLFITELFDLHFIQKCLRITKAVKTSNPECHVVLDTMDCHWKKYVRKALVSHHDSDWATAWRYLELETQLYPKADLLTVVTQDDGADIALSIEQSAPYAVLPNCYLLADQLPDFKQTSGLCFVGPASVNHNLDAMRHLRDTILPHILAKQPDVRIHVFGAGWNQYQKEFDTQTFHFPGHVRDLDRSLAKHRVFVCPLTYGAGLKGKLGSAASAGIPVVSTSVGSEGYPLSNRQECLVSDNPEEFAGYCLDLLRDSDLWETKRIQFRKMIEQNFGMPALERHLDLALSKLCP